MEYTVGIGSDAVMYIPSFMKIRASIQILMGRGAKTHRQHDYLMDLHSLFSK
jgi:hypothetical protein